MNVEFVPGALVNIVGALLVAGLGVLVVALGPARSVNRAFLLFAGGFGIGILLTNFWFPDLRVLNTVMSLVCLAFFLLASFGVLWLGHVAGRREDDVRWPTFVGAAAGALAVAPIVLVTLGSTAALDDAYYAAWNGPPTSSGFVKGYAFGAFALLGATLAAGATLTLRASRLPSSEAVRFRGMALLAAAVTLFPGFAAGVFAPALDGRFWSFSVGALPVLAVLAAAWLRLTIRSPDPAVARNVVLLLLFGPLLGLAFSALGLGHQGGTVRAVSVAVLAYGILRHQLLGIDVKVRWGISKTTLAAVFIAVFFVASEAAQEFFGETLGSSYVGILAAGALVFAIAPLSRLADRVAEKAVPDAAPSSRAPPSREEAYRNAVRWALRDRVVSREEELQLMHLADELGLPARRALEIRHEVEGAREAT